MPKLPLLSSLRLPLMPSSLLHAGVAPRAEPDGLAALHELRREVICSLRRSAEQRGRPRRELFAVDEALSASLFADLQLETCTPLNAALAQRDAQQRSQYLSRRLRVAGRSGGGASRGAAADGDLRSFVAEISEGITANPLLLQLLAQLSRRAAREGRGIISREDDAEIYRLVHYSHVLERITRTLATDPEIAAAVYQALREGVRAEPEWWRHLSPFEHAKLFTVELTLDKFVQARRDVSIDESFGHLGLPFNILEAVLEDLRFGHGDNARAGLALMWARPGQSEPGQSGASLSSDRRRAVRMHLPQPTRWKELYISWNMAFTSIYGDSPYFAAALLAPCVLGAAPSEFMYHRVFALHLHMAATIRRRQAQGVLSSTERVHSSRDWRHDELTEVWGRLNKEGARRYQLRRALALRRAGVFAGGFHQTNLAFHQANRRAVHASKRAWRGWRSWITERQRSRLEGQWSGREVGQAGDTGGGSV